MREHPTSVPTRRKGKRTMPVTKKILRFFCCCLVIVNKRREGPCTTWILMDDFTNKKTITL